MKNINNKLVLILGTNVWASKIAIDFKETGFPVAMVGMADEHVLRRNLSFYDCLYLGQRSIGDITAKLIQPDDLDFILSAESTSVKEKLLLLNDGHSFPLFSKLDYSMVQSKMEPFIIVNTTEKFSPYIDLSLAGNVFSIAANATPGKNCHVYIERFDRNHLGEIRIIGDDGVNIETDAECLDKNSVYVQSHQSGVLVCSKELGELISIGEEIVKIGSHSVKASVNGKIIGLRHSGELINAGDYIAELDLDLKSNKHLLFSLNTKYISLFLLKMAFRELSR